MISLFSGPSSFWVALPHLDVARCSTFFVPEPLLESISRNTLKPSQQWECRYHNASSWWDTTQIDEVTQLEPQDLVHTESWSRLRPPLCRRARKMSERRSRSFPRSRRILEEGRAGEVVSTETTVTTERRALCGIAWTTKYGGSCASDSGANGATHVEQFVEE